MAPTTKTTAAADLPTPQPPHRSSYARAPPSHDPFNDSDRQNLRPHFRRHRVIHPPLCPRGGQAGRALRGVQRVIKSW